MRSSMTALTYGKLYDLQAMQPERPPNRRVCPGTTPAQVVRMLRSAGFDDEQAARIREADGELFADLRRLADRVAKS